MELADSKMIIDMDRVKAGFFDLMQDIVNDNYDGGFPVCVDEAVVVLNMALKIIERVGVKCE